MRIFLLQNNEISRATYESQEEASTVHSCMKIICLSIRPEACPCASLRALAFSQVALISSQIQTQKTQLEALAQQMAAKQKAIQDLDTQRQTLHNSFIQVKTRVGVGTALRSPFHVAVFSEVYRQMAFS